MSFKLKGGCNLAVVSQISDKEYAERLKTMSPAERCVTRAARTNYFPNWPVSKVRKWLEENGLAPQMPVEENYVRVALFDSSKGVAMVGEEGSDAKYAFFDTLYEWYEDPGSCARQTLWKAVGCSSVSLTKSWDEIEEIEDESGNKIRRVVSIYIVNISYPNEGFPNNDGLIWVTEADDPRVATEDRELLKVLLERYCKLLCKE